MTRLLLSQHPPSDDSFEHVQLPAPERCTEFPVHLTWPDRSVDAITIDEIFDRYQHQHCARLLHECRRILKPEGRIVLTLPAKGSDGQSPGQYGIADIEHFANTVGLRMIGCQEPEPDSTTGGNYAIVLSKPERRLGCDEHPLVTIAIPSYKPTFFKETLSSALNQTYQNLEILICDDCPTNDIEAIVSPHMRNDGRIRYLRNPETLGPRPNGIRCFEEARGEFFKLLSDDDVLETTCIERLLDCFRADYDITLATSRRTCIDEAGKPLADIFETLPPVPMDAVIEGLSLGFVLLLSVRNFIGEPSTPLFRKAELAHIKPDFWSVDRQRVFGVNDIASWVNLATRGNVAYVVTPLSHFRRHPQQNQKLLRERVEKGMFAAIPVMRKFYDRHGFTEGQYERTIQWRPCASPQGDWQLQTMCKDFSGWAATVQPNNAPASDEERNYRAASDLLAKGDTENAVAALIAMAETGSRHWAVYNDLGAYAWQTGDTAGAVELFRQAWQLNRGTPLAGCNLAQALLVLGQWNEAGSLIGELLQRHPENTDVHALRLRLEQRGR